MSASPTLYAGAEVGPAPADPIAAEIARLGDLDIHDLRQKWRKVFRKDTPAHLSRSLLYRVLAYRIQAEAFGDLDRETIRFLDKIARERTRGGKSPVPAVENSRTGRLKPGSVLVREHDGVMHRVEVREKGFSWNGTAYDSLSGVAKAITGTSWNGRRFFGLKDRAAKRVEARP